MPILLLDYAAIGAQDLTVDQPTVGACKKLRAARIVDRDRQTVLCQALGDGGSDPASATGDDGGTGVCRHHTDRPFALSPSYIVTMIFPRARLEAW